MAEKSKMIWNPCPQCMKSTMHDIMCSHHDNGGEEYHCDMAYMVVKCRGCGNSSFRYVFSDYENSYPSGDGEWEIDRTIETYPKFIKGHSELDGMRYVPEIVSMVYEESLTAIREGAAVLAGLGLRGTVEAICNDRDIKGKNLEVRIARLATQGLISQKDAERLHAIRFLGNDAAHDIKQPSKRQIEIALRIIDHLIATVYILDAEAKGRLDTIITEYEDFLKILNRHLKDFTAGDEFPLAKYLEKDVRRIQGSLTQMEQKLMADIAAGEFKGLSAGKIDTFGTNPAQLQHFIKV